MESISFHTPVLFGPIVKYTVGIEAWFNQTHPQVELAASQVMFEYGLADEMRRMLILKEALSWRWHKFQEEAAITQMYLSLTMDETVHLLMLIGWNAGAGYEEVTLAQNFMKCFFGRIEALGINFNLLNQQNPEPEKPKYRPYGQRLDTVVKLTKLYENREKERARGKIKTTRQAACEFVGIALSTFKKYNAILYERWYDKEYEATI
jgi:hypothetical protein